MFVGDRNPGDTIGFFFNTVDTSFAPATISGATAAVYKDASTVESTAGLTLSIDYDSRTGLHRVSINTGADGTFYSAGSDFVAVLTAGTIAGVSAVGAQLGHFSLQNRQVTVRSVLSGAIVAASFAANALDAVWSTATRTLSAAGVQAIWDALTSALTTVGSVGKRIADDLDATISSRLASASYTAPDNATISTINTKIGTPASSVSADIAAVPTANANADALLDRTAGVETGWTVRQWFRVAGAAIFGKADGLATSTVHYRNPADTKNRITASVDADGNRTSVTTDAT